MTLIRYFTGVPMLDLKIVGLLIWITIMFYEIWTCKYLDYEFKFQLLYVDLGLKMLGLRIWITPLLDFTGFGLGNAWTLI